MSKRPRNLRNLIKRGSIYHFRATIDGRQIWQSLDTTDQQLAIQRARKLRSELTAGRWEFLDRIRKRNNYSQLSEIIDAYQDYAAGRDLRPRTVKNNCLALLKIIRDVHGDDYDAPAARSSILTADLLRDYQAARIASAKASGPLAIDRAKTSAHSTAQQARSIFARRCLQSSEYQHLHLPDLSGFLGYSLERGQRRGYRAPETEILEATAAAAAKLRIDDPARWLAFMLAANLGLRRSEGVAARWDWVREIRLPDGKTAIIMEVIKRDDYDPKGTERIINVHPGVWDDILSVRASIDTILPGTKTDRINLFRENARWLRSLGWKAQKPNHELRKHFGSQVATEHSIYAAQSALGHGDPRLTSSVYAAYLSTDSVVRVF